jgi:heme exporter protein C
MAEKLNNSKVSGSIIFRYWWKILGVIIVLYTFFMGLLTPLKPGITEVSPSTVNAGQRVRFEATGYNSNYSKNITSLKAWLKLDSEYAITANIYENIDDQKVAFIFEIPAFLPYPNRYKEASLIIDNEGDGTSIYPGAVTIVQETSSIAQGKVLWERDIINRLHDKDIISFPFRNILGETIRNTFFHVPLWFAMFILFIAALIFCIRYLKTFNLDDDRKAAAFTNAGMLLGLLGLITGAIWAKYTWGAFWSWDVKQNLTAVGLLIYGAYFVLRASFEDPERRGRISAVYNIFAFATLIPLFYVIPKMTDSLHPGAGGNIAFGSQDLDNTMRLVFYPAIIGWTLMGAWIAQIVFRINNLREQLLEKQ